MASSKDYLTFILELLRNMDDIHYRAMMGEYILYKGNLIFGGIYDNRFLVKKTESLLERIFKEIIPYPNAKPMLLIDSEDPEEVEEIVESVINDLNK